MSNMYLIGYRTTGKTSVADELSTLLNKKVVHMDALFTKQKGPIDIFVRNYGWNAFREEETKMLQQISQQDNQIVDCGGGIVVKEDHIDIMKKTGTIIWLQASVETIQKRLTNDDRDRPPLSQQSTVDEVASVLEERKPLYESASDHIIDTEGKTVQEIAKEIAKVIT